MLVKCLGDYISECKCVLVLCVCVSHYITDHECKYGNYRLSNLEADAGANCYTKNGHYKSTMQLES